MNFRMKTFLSVCRTFLRGLQDTLSCVSQFSEGVRRLIRPVRRRAKQKTTRATARAAPIAKVRPTPESYDGRGCLAITPDGSTDGCVGTPGSCGSPGSPYSVFGQSEPYSETSVADGFEGSIWTYSPTSGLQRLTESQHNGEVQQGTTYPRQPYYPYWREDQCFEEPELYKLQQAEARRRPDTA